VVRHWTSSWTRCAKAASVIILGFAAIPGAIVVVQTPAVAGADVCASVGRRVSVGGCANIADTVAQFVPPPSYYAPMPGDDPPPDYTPNIGVCANVGRRVSVSGCI